MARDGSKSKLYSGKSILYPAYPTKYLNKVLSSSTVLASLSTWVRIRLGRETPAKKPSGRTAWSPKAASKTSYPLAADRKSTRLNSSHVKISYAVFCLKKKI